MRFVLSLALVACTAEDAVVTGDALRPDDPFGAMDPVSPDFAELPEAEAPFPVAPPPPAGGCGPGVGAQVGATPYADLGAALAVATAGDVLWICPGVHHGVWRSVDAGGLTIAGWTGDPADVVLDADFTPALAALDLMGTGTTWLSGLTFHHVGARGVALMARFDHLILSDIVIEGGDGGGVIAYSNRNSFRDLEVRDNLLGRAAVYVEYSGAILPSRFEDVYIHDNVGGQGFMMNSAHIQNPGWKDVVFINPRIRDNSHDGWGGALTSTMQGTRVWVEGGEIVNNTALAASAVDMAGCNRGHTWLLMHDTVITDNTDDYGMPIRAAGDRCHIGLVLSGVQLLRNGMSARGIADSVIHLARASAQLYNVDFGSGADANTVPDLMGCAVDYGAGATGRVDTRAQDFCL